MPTTADKQAPYGRCTSGGPIPAIGVILDRSCNQPLVKIAGGALICPKCDAPLGR